MIIYQATNNINGKIYIGQTIFSLKKRTGEHRKLSRWGSKIYFHSAIRKYGFENFNFESIAWCDEKTKLDFLERFYISFKNSKSPVGYNLSDGGDGGSPKGRKLSEETRKKMSLAKRGKKNNLGYKPTQETINKIRQKTMGQKRTEETKKKMSESHRGRIYSDEIKKKMSDSAKRTYELGRINSAKGKPSPLRGIKRNKSAWNKGLKGFCGGRIPWNKGLKEIYSKETIEKMRQAKNGKIPWNKGVSGELINEPPNVCLKFV